MNEQQREHARLAKLSAYRINATWNLFERFVIDGKPPREALRLAAESMDVWSPWFEENHIEAPEPPDMPTQVEQAAAKVTDAINKVLDEKERRKWALLRWLQQLCSRNPSGFPRLESPEPAPQTSTNQQGGSE